MNFVHGNHYEDFQPQTIKTSHHGRILTRSIQLNKTFDLKTAHPDHYIVFVSFV